MPSHANETPPYRLAGVLALTLTGGAVAAIPSSGNKIWSCYDATGKVRIVDADAATTRLCNPGETALNWNQTGPQGAQGPAGPKGATGATGPQGPAGPSFVWGRMHHAAWEPGVYYRTLLTVTVPKGLYHVSAKTVAYEPEVPGVEAWMLTTCRLVLWAPGGTDVADTLDISQAEVGDDGPERTTLALEGLTHAAADDTKISLQCKDDGGLVAGWENELQHSKLFAQQVGGYYAT